MLLPSDQEKAEHSISSSDQQTDRATESKSQALFQMLLQLSAGWLSAEDTSNRIHI